MINLLRRRPDILPSIAAVISASYWGLYWVPMRSIEEAGVGALWSPAVVFAFVVAAFLPLAVWRWRAFAGVGRGVVVASCLAGSAFALYAVAFNFTEIVRVQLLFYASPVWSTALGLVFLGERMTINRALALIVGLCGLAVVLGADVGLPLPRNAGDWMALASGIFWSFASVAFFKGGPVLIFEKAYLFVLFALAMALALMLLPLGADNPFPHAAQLLSVWPMIVVFGAMVLPALVLIVWPTSVLSPARVGVLFMAEIVVGVGSAALLTDEPFGLREIAGTLLIITAGLIEVMRKQTIEPGTRPG